MSASEQGFTLLETLIALVILSLAFTALFESSGISVRAIASSNTHMKARLLAETMLAEQTAIRDLKSGTTRGRYEQFEWEADVSPGTGDWAELSKDSQWRPYLVTITVRWPIGRSLKLETVRVVARSQQ